MGHHARALRGAVRGEIGRQPREAGPGPFPEPRGPFLLEGHGGGTEHREMAVPAFEIVIRGQPADRRVVMGDPGKPGLGPDA